MPRIKGANLPPRQAETLKVIADYVRANGTLPTVREIQRAMGAKSSRSPNLEALREKDYLRPVAPRLRRLSYRPTAKALAWLKVHQPTKPSIAPLLPPEDLLLQPELPLVMHHD